MDKKPKALEIKDKIIKLISNSGWDKLSEELNLSDLLIVLQQLIEDTAAGNKFYPTMREIFTPLTTLPSKELKVVMIGEPTLSNRDNALGLLFSAKNKNSYKNQKIFIEDLRKFTGREDIIDTRYLSEQGVMMLPRTLTVPTWNSILNHDNLWNNVVDTIIKHIDNNYKNVIFVAFNKKAWAKIKDVKSSHYKFYMKLSSDWNNIDFYNHINSILSELNKKEIQW